MTLLEQLQKEIQHLPLEKQGEALEFIRSLQKKSRPKPTGKISLRKHPAYGLWRGRNINALDYQQKVRTEWETRS